MPGKLGDDGLQRTYDERQRRTQVMAYVGEETQFHLRQLCLLYLLHLSALFLYTTVVTVMHEAIYHIYCHTSQQQVEQLHPP